MIGWKPVSPDWNVASARIRCLEPLRHLRRRGHPVERFSTKNCDRYRAVVLQKLYDPSHLELAQSLRAQGKRVVLDMCDNHLYNPEQLPRHTERAKWLKNMLQAVDVVTVSTETLARALGVTAVVIRDGIVPPGPVSRAHQVLSAPRRSGAVELVWYGLHPNSPAPAGMQDVLRVAPVLEALAKKHHIRLSIVSNSDAAYRSLVEPLRFPTRYIDWGSYARFCGVFPSFDICIIPVAPNEFTLCKSNNRLALSLYLGVPVVAERIPSYEEFEPFCALGEWSTGLERYILSPRARHSDADAGGAYVRSNYLIEHSAEEWLRLFGAILAGKDLTEAGLTVISPECPNQTGETSTMRGRTPYG